MKKLIVLVILLVISASIFAQGIEFGAKAGLNLATVTKSGGDKMRTGIHAGMFAEYTFSDYVGLQGELLYSMMGSKWGVVDAMAGSNGTIINKTDYIVLPVLVKLYVLERLSLDLGPQLGYMVSAKSKYPGAGSVSYYHNVDNKLDISFGMGLTCKVTSKFDLTGRYNLGLSKIREGFDYKNNVILFGIGYRF